MTVALVLTGNALVVATFCGLITHLLRGQSRERQAWSTERTTILDRLMFATDKTWALPPREPEPEEAPDPDADLLVTI